MGIDPDGHWVWPVVMIVGSVALSYVKYKMEVKYGYRRYDKTHRNITMGWAFLNSLGGRGTKRLLKMSGITGRANKFVKGHDQFTRFTIGFGVGQGKKTGISRSKWIQNIASDIKRFPRHCYTWAKRRVARISRIFRFN